MLKNLNVVDAALFFELPEVDQAHDLEALLVEAVILRHGNCNAVKARKLANLPVDGADIFKEGRNESFAVLIFINPLCKVLLSLC